MIINRENQKSGIPEENKEGGAGREDKTVYVTKKKSEERK